MKTAHRLLVANHYSFKSPIRCPAIAVRWMHVPPLFLRERPLDAHSSAAVHWSLSPATAGRPSVQKFWASLGKKILNFLRSINCKFWRFWASFSAYTSYKVILKHSTLNPNVFFTFQTLLTQKWSSKEQWSTQFLSTKKTINPKTK